MSTRINKLIPFALLALAVEVNAGPVVEGLLNDYTVNSVHIAQVDDAGRCIMVVHCIDGGGVPAYRVVASASGDVKLFADLAAAQSLILRAKFAPGAAVTFKRKEKTRTLGDPIASLKTLYKSFKAEKLVGEKANLATAGKIAAGAALGWNTAVGTPEAFEYADYLAKLATVTESVDFSTARIAALAASLVAAGIDPVTVV